MLLKDYKEKCESFKNYQKSVEFIYPVLGFMEEVGELTGKFAKIFRKKGSVRDLTDEERKDIAKELGDICWMVAVNLHGDCENRSSELYDKCKSHTDIDQQAVLQSISALSSFANEYVGRLATGVIESLPMPLDHADVCFLNIMHIASMVGYTITEVWQMNIDKLTDRKNRGVVNGSGDNR